MSASEDATKFATCKLLRRCGGKGKQPWSTAVEGTRLRVQVFVYYSVLVLCQCQFLDCTQLYPASRGSLPSFSIVHLACLSRPSRPLGRKRCNRCSVARGARRTRSSTLSVFWWSEMVRLRCRSRSGRRHLPSSRGLWHLSRQSCVCAIQV